jgi:hypothetical protein
MRRIDGITAVLNLFGLGKHGYRNGNKPEGILATKCKAETFNATQEEICTVIESTGAVINPDDNTQLYTAIKTMIAGGDYKGSCRVASTANINTAAPGANIDGVAMVAGNRALLKDQAAPAQNGIWIWNGAAVAMTRALDADDGAELNSGAIVPIEEGTTNQDTQWFLKTDEAVTIGVTALVFAKLSVSTLPQGYRTGYSLANNAGNPNTQIDFSPGAARGSNNDVVLTTTITKILQGAGAWAAGNAANGLFNGAKAVSTWYHCFAIRNSTTGVVDCGFDTSISAANIPAGYSDPVYLNSIKTNGSGNIIAFLNFGLTMLWKTPIKDVSVSSVGSGISTNYTVSTPPGIRVEGKFSGFSEGGNSGFYLHPTDTPDIIVNIELASYVGGTVISSGSAGDYGASAVEALTDTSSQIRFTSLANANAPTTNIAIVTNGWTLVN